MRPRSVGHLTVYFAHKGSEDCPEVSGGEGGDRV